MVNKSCFRSMEIVNNLFSGHGEVIKKDLADVKPINVRMCCEMNLNPGAEIGFHMHFNETEIYYIVSGKAEYTDNDSKIQLSEGDTAICLNGDGHAIKNNGEDILKFFAIVILE